MKANQQNSDRMPLKMILLGAFTAAGIGMPVLAETSLTGFVSEGSGYIGNGNRSIHASLDIIGGSSSIGSVHIITKDADLLTAKKLLVTPSTIPEGTAGQISGIATLDDNTVNILNGSDIHFERTKYPFASLDADGLLTTSNVYSDVSVDIAAYYLGAENNTNVLILDTDPDNYGSYAGDDLSDNWQVDNFGMDNPDAEPDKDPDADGNDNEHEWITGTSPTNSASSFQIVGIELVDGAGSQIDVTFDPTFTDRTYQLLSSRSLTSGVWDVLASWQESTNGTERTARHLDATSPAAFYRIEVTYNP